MLQHIYATIFHMLNVVTYYLNTLKHYALKIRKPKSKPILYSFNLVSSEKLDDENKEIIVAGDFNCEFKKKRVWEHIMTFKALGGEQ